MGYEVGKDKEHDRFIGYGVPSICDHPGCNEEIHRGLSYVCGHGELYGGDEGCGQFFCSDHGGGSLCERCEKNREDTYVKPFDIKPDTPEWLHHLETHPSWEEWRRGRNAKASK